jgi:hypothetical protein
MGTPVTVQYEKQQVACTIDVSQPASTIIKTLCMEHFNIQEPPALYAVRLVDTEELITDEVHVFGKKKICCGLVRLGLFTEGFSLL